MAVWQGRISPVFDTAGKLLLVDAEAGREQGRSVAMLDERIPPLRAKRLRELGVDVLLCGAVSRPLAAMLAAERIEVIGWLSGPAEEVLAAYLAGRLWQKRFHMPGCCGRALRRRRGWRWGITSPWSNGSP